MNFLRDFISLNSKTEIPEEFALWCGLSGVSSVLGRRLWIDMGTYIIYPNLYIILVAGSGRCRKSTAIGMIERLVRTLDPGPNIIAQRITPEGLIDALKRSKIIKDVERDCDGFVLVDELSTFLNKKTYDSGLASLLIPFYDCKDKFEYRTKGRGIESISNSCLSLLGASTIDWIKNAIPIDAIGGGLTSRMIFVYVEKPPPPVAITSFGRDKEKLQENLVKGLEQMLLLEGEVKLDKDAWDFYKIEYEKFYLGSKMFDNPILSGYASRRHVHLLKLGMVFAACELNSSRIILEPRHLEGARSILELSESSMPQVLSLISSSEKGTLTELVYQRVLREGKMTKANLVGAFSHRLDVTELESVLNTLVHSKKVSLTSNGRDLFYTPSKSKL